MTEDTVTSSPLLDRYVLAGTAVFLLVVGGMGWFTFRPLLGSPEQKSNYTHLHCSECKAEMAYSAPSEGKTCPRCRDRKSRLIPTIGSLKKGGYTPGVLVQGRVVAFGVVTLVLLQAQVFLYLWRARAIRQRKQEADRRTFYCRCPFCNRKLRYPISKSGTGAVCPGCKTAFLLPEEDTDEWEDPSIERPA